MTEEASQAKVALADSAAVIERASVELALMEEPSGFLGALEELAADE